MPGAVKLTIAVVAAALVALVPALSFEFSQRDWSYCNSTLSQKSRTHNILGMTTDVSHRKSALQARLESIGVPIKHDWSNGATGFNVFGYSNRHSCPPITPAVRLNREVLQVWLDISSDGAVRAFHSLLQSRDFKAIELRIDKIEAEVRAYEAALNRRETPQPPSSETE